MTIDTTAAASVESNRGVIRIVIAFILLSQAVIVGAFLMHAIDEPYPAIILPAFDQVLAESNGTYAFVLPRFMLRLASGESTELTVDTLFRSGQTVNGARAYWVVSRLAPPPSDTVWTPSLATYGFVPPSRRSSPGFLNWLGEYTGAVRFAKSPVALSIIWQRRRFATGRGSIEELAATHLGSVEVPVKQSSTTGVNEIDR